MVLDLSRLPEALRDYGVRVKTLPNWLDDGYGPFDLAGQMSHHTAMDGPASDRTAEAMRRGRPDLSGPLCNGHGGLEVDRRFTCWLVAGREAHHAGKGSAVVLREVRAGVHDERTALQRGLTDDGNGNPFFWGWEWQHVGTTPVFHDDLLEGMGRCSAAFCELTGLPPETHIGHKHWTRRKIDPSWPGSLPDLTRRYLEDDMPLTDGDVTKIVTAMRPVIVDVVRGELNRATVRPEKDGVRPAPWGGGSFAVAMSATIGRVVEIERRMGESPASAAAPASTAPPGGIAEGVAYVVKFERAPS